MVNTSSATKPRWEMPLAAALFGTLLAVHGWLLSIGWTNGNLPGQEFRQTQTAISALFVQREQNFALAYPTPVLGAPWTAPMEFPLYQWTVVKVSDWTGLPLVQAGRAVSAACFYLAVAGLFPLLGALGCMGPRRWIAATFALTCPIYVFYSRAFLIETMALAFSVWFLVAFVRFVNRPVWWALVLAALFGVGAALVKITTFMVFLVPAGWLTAVRMWQARPRGLAAVAREGAWALAVIAAPIAAGAWWTRFADAVKHASLNTRFLESTNLVGFNFGTSDDRFSAVTWSLHWRNLSQGVASPVLVGATVLLALTLGRRAWRPLAICVVCYLAPLAIFPVLYSRHDYYSIANALFLLAAVGLAVAEGWHSGRRWLIALVLVALHVVQLWTYRNTYLDLQARWSPGGSELTKAVRAMTGPDDVIVGAGLDWDSNLAFYTQRRAYMIRYGMEQDWTFLHQAFRGQAGQPVTVFVRRGERAADPTLLGLMEQYFEIDPRPIFHWKDETVFGRKDRRAIMIDAVRRTSAIPEVRLDSSTETEKWSMMGREMSYADLLESDRALLSILGTERPVKLFTEFGLSAMEQDGRPVLFAHAETRFWFPAPAGRSVVRVEFCVMPGAYDGPERDRSDGVEFAIDEEKPDGTRTRLQSVFLDPNRTAADRGFHVLEVTLDQAAPSTIVVSSGPGPHGNKARDWSAFASVRITRADDRR